MVYSSLLIIIVTVAAFVFYFTKKPKVPNLKLVDDKEKELKAEADALKAKMDVDYAHLERVKKSNENLSDKDREDFWKNN